MTPFKINIAKTNNPSILKFEANQTLIADGNLEFNNIDEAKESPLAQQLFFLPFVKAVYISANFIGIAKYDIVEWDEVSEAVAEQLENNLNDGMPIFTGNTDTKKIPINIYAESTPNPAVMKFVANKKLIHSSIEFKNIDETNHAPLAKALFHFPFVKEIFLDENYISITKYEMAEWQDIVMEIRDFIRNYLAEDKTILSKESFEQVTAKASPETHKAPELDSISQQIIALLDEHIKPAVASDGGNIQFQHYDKDNKIVHVVLQGACSGCPSSTFTLKNGIEQLLKSMIPEAVNEVVAANG
ncbi:MAG: NifU family protein [Flavobacteriaceae bacterium]|nr:NifU family protein [Flavobacteriaceae bacterium]